MATLTVPDVTPATNGAPTSAARPAWREPYLLSTDQYDRMIDARVLREDDRVELLEGLLVSKMARNPPPDGTLGMVEEALRARLPAGWCIRMQMAVATADSRPEPDLAVVPGPPRRYLKQHPAAAEAALVIEVADSSLDDDRERKGRIYARASIPCYWIVNLIDNQVEVYTDPTGPDEQPHYRKREDFKAPSAMPLVIAGQEIARIPVGDLLP